MLTVDCQCPAHRTLWCSQINHISDVHANWLRLRQRHL